MSPLCVLWLLHAPKLIMEKNHRVAEFNHGRLNCFAPSQGRDWKVFVGVFKGYRMKHYSRLMFCSIIVCSVQVRDYFHVTELRQDWGKKDGLNWV